MNERDDWLTLTGRIVIAIIALAMVWGISTCDRQVSDLQRRVGQLESERR